MKLHPEDGGSMDLWNVGILPRHYTESQPKRPRLASSPPWKPQNSHQVTKVLIMHFPDINCYNFFLIPLKLSYKINFDVAGKKQKS